MELELLSKAFGDVDDCFVLEAYRSAFEYTARPMEINGNRCKDHCHTGSEGDDCDGGDFRVVVAFDDMIL